MPSRSTHERVNWFTHVDGRETERRRGGRRSRGGLGRAMRYHATRPLVRRMQAIDLALRAGRWPTDKSLAKELKVDPRTIRRDIEFMRDEQNAPIEYDRGRGGS